MAKTDEGKTNLWLIGGVPAGNKDGIGANSQTVEYEENGKTTRLLVDFGVKLPSGDMKEKHPELSSVIPDFRPFLDKENGERADYPVDAILVTHCHADHLDGLIYMAMYAAEKNIKMPKIMGSQYTRNTFFRLLRQHNLPKSFVPDFDILTPCKGKKIGKIEIKSVPVSHTTVGACGYIFETPTAGYFNPGDNRLQPSHTGVGGNNQLMVGMLRKSRITHCALDSTSSGMKNNENFADGGNITFDDSLNAVETIFSENKGKQVFSPTISRSIENWLPLLIKSRDHGKKVFIDGYQQRGAFRDWQGDSVVFYMAEDGSLLSTNDKKTINELQEKSIQTYCAEDFSKTVWDYDNVMNANAVNYVNSVDKKDRVVLVSGAFAEASQTMRSGGVRLACGDHLMFAIDKETVIDGAQRIIKGLSDTQVKDMYRGFLRRGAKVYMNELSLEVLQADQDTDLMRSCTFIKRQPSGHSNRDDTRESVNLIVSNSKNSVEFGKEDGYKLQVIGIHGNEIQRENSAAAVDSDVRVESHIFTNGDIVELKKGSSKVIKHITVGEQRFLGIINDEITDEYVFKALDGNYNPTDNGDITIKKFNSSIEREDTRQRKIREAEGLQDEGPMEKMNRYVVKHGKNAGKKKLSPIDEEKRRSKIERKAKLRQTKKARSEARMKKHGRDGR